MLHDQYIGEQLESNFGVKTLTHNYTQAYLRWPMDTLVSSEVEFSDKF